MIPNPTNQSIMYGWCSFQCSKSEVTTKERSVCRRTNASLKNYYHLYTESTIPNTNSLKIVAVLQIRMESGNIHLHGLQKLEDLAGGHQHSIHPSKT
jgi:hypothetical protein